MRILHVGLVHFLEHPNPFKKFVDIITYGVVDKPDCNIIVFQYQGRLRGIKYFLKYRYLILISCKLAENFLSHKVV